MDITAIDGKFFVAAFRIDNAKYKWDKAGLSVSGERKYPLNVQTNRGDFVECLNEDGEVISHGGDGDWYYVQPKPEKQTLRFKKLPPLKLSVSDMDKKRAKVTRYLIDQSPYSAGVPDELTAVVKWFADKLNEIPKDCRKSARVDFSDNFSYGESYPNIKITYQQPETDKELTLRLQVEAERARRSKMAKVAQFEKLKAELTPVHSPV